MRARMIVIGAAVVIAAAVAIAVATGGSDPSPASTGGFRAETVEAGAVTVRLEPHHVDATGAEFRVTLDTHSGDLGMDLAQSASLTVGGVAWPAASWDGAGAGGHHRSGTLRFDAVGTATGAVELRLDGFSSPVTGSWQIDG